MEKIQNITNTFFKWVREGSKFEISSIKINYL